MMLLVFNGRSSFGHYSFDLTSFADKDLPMVRGLGAPPFRQRHVFYGMVTRDF